MAQLYRKLLEYGQSDFYPFHMPGHKRNKNLLPVELPFEIDITEIEGFDNLHHPEEILLEIEQKAAAYYDTQESLFCINGSTAALLTAISAAVKKGGKILVARNCHKAVYHGMYLRDLNPVYLYPQVHEKYGIFGGISPIDVEKALKADPEIQAVLITSPTYDGVISDVKRIAEAAHRHGIPLIVDEAHGAHFVLSDIVPSSAIKCGADLVVQSLHKTLPVMTQCAILHICSDHINRDEIVRFSGIYQSSSPSYVFMANMDACIDWMLTEGKNMCSVYTEILLSARKILSDLKVLKLIPAEITGTYEIYGYDSGKILIYTGNSSLSGKELSDILRVKYHLEMEMASEYYITALTSVGDTKEGFDRLCDALLEIDRKLEITEEKEFKAPDILPDVRINLADAMDAGKMEMDLFASEGYISGEFVYLYPPGIPILAPGEKITGQVIENMRRYRECGFSLQGLKDYSNQKILVIKE